MKCELKKSIKDAKRIAEEKNYRRKKGEMKENIKERRRKTERKIVEERK